MLTWLGLPDPRPYDPSHRTRARRRRLIVGLGTRPAPGDFMQSVPRCLMVTMATLATPTGYGIRTWLALRAVREVQPDGAPRPLLLCVESLRDWLRPRCRRAIREAARSAGVRLICLPSFPKSLPGATHLNAAWVAAAVRAVAAWRGAGVVHGQSHMAAGAVAWALGGMPSKAMVFDVHGVDIEEAVDDGRLRGGGAAHRLRLHLERRAIERADWILPVTTSLAAHLRGRAAPRGSVRVVPCVSTLPAPAAGVASSRRQVRARLGWGDAPVALYLGSASAWQDPRRIVAAFAEALRREARLRLLVVTPDRSEFERLLAEAGIPPSAFAVETHPHGQVAAVAAAADVGLLLRDDSLINRVASPTKFAEYLSVGVAVVLTDVLEDFARLTLQHDVGAVLPAQAPASDVAQAILRLACAAPSEREARGRRAQELVQSSLGLASVLGTYREIYAAPRGAGPCEPGPVPTAAS